uniref:Ground-like domain-containing protein n=1 Tax=Steinernema glaseri TaxID=37863 RepID=A0A1I8AW17_9BILA
MVSAAHCIVFIALALPLANAIFFGGLSGLGGGSSGGGCCGGGGGGCGGGGGGCGGGCGGGGGGGGCCGRKKREAIEEADIVYSDKLSAEERCNNDTLRRIIKNALADDVPTTLEKLNDVLNRKTPDYVIICGPTIQKWYQFTSKIKNFCNIGNDKVTCTVFTTRAQDRWVPPVETPKSAEAPEAAETNEATDTPTPKELPQGADKEGLKKEKIEPTEKKIDEKTGKETEESEQFRELKSKVKAQ